MRRQCGDVLDKCSDRAVTRDERYRDLGRGPTFSPSSFAVTETVDRA
jgi:hypothetical protein